MRNLLVLFVLMTFTVLSVSAQTKKDGTPDMRYKVNKERYGDIYSQPSYSQPSYSQPSYSQPSYSYPSYSEPKNERNYENGGKFRIQKGYMKSNGTYVEPHLKTTPDNYKWNNLNSLDNN